eukprot:1161146-Pelagomonas_calceolata.AAC.2
MDVLHDAFAMKKCSMFVLNGPTPGVCDDKTCVHPHVHTHTHTHTHTHDTHTTNTHRHPGELLLGVMLIYYFRSLERRAGSSKFACFVTFTTGLSLALQVSVRDCSSSAMQYTDARRMVPQVGSASMENFPA